MTGELLLIRGQVQGVGFRPTVWRVASDLGLTGDVRNTAEGVEVRIWGDTHQEFANRLKSELPVLASVDAIECHPLDGPPPTAFTIEQSAGGAMKTAVAPDAATCDDCLAEIRDPFAHRYRYPLTNCTNCGPRISIVEGAPYDRSNTTMKSFDMCPTCATEYEDPTDRRFHAQPIACHVCGPKAWLEHMGGGTVNCEAFSMMDDVDAAGGALMNGFIVAVKGLGGFHLACDATRTEVVERLRDGKRRKRKAFALMARDVDVIRRYAKVSDDELALLTSPQAPIVLLEVCGEELPDCVAPGLNRLGFMLPHTPMHSLMLRRMKRPVVMTSGNLTGHPQCTNNDQARKELADIADFGLFHDRDIANRIDDSVVRVDSERQTMLRCARGYAPISLSVPEGFEAGSTVLAMGGELKNAFCIVKDDQLILSQHMGDLSTIDSALEAKHNLSLYSELYEHEPDLIVVDQHPQYYATQSGRELAGERPVIEVQHHHAHIAACMAENQYPLGAVPVLGIAMDGLGLGEDGTIWGGEFLSCSYLGFQRLAFLKPVALPGADAASREPWRNLYAHLMAEMGWTEFAMNFNKLDVFKKLEAAPRETLDAMIQTGTNAPLSSSCGRLFDAAAALVGLCWDEQSYEGEAAMLFEAVLDPTALDEDDEFIYPFSIPLMQGKGMPYIEPLAVWRAMLGDLLLDTPVGTISTRFHRGLAKVIVDMAIRLTTVSEMNTVALSGGCMQNATLCRLVEDSLKNAGLNVLVQSKIPANDGGLALGQAVIGLAVQQEGCKSCA